MNAYPISPNSEGMQSLINIVGSMERAYEIYYQCVALSQSYITDENHLGLVPFKDWVRYPAALEMERCGLAHTDVEPIDGVGVYIVGARPRLQIVRRPLEVARG